MRLRLLLLVCLLPWVCGAVTTNVWIGTNRAVWSATTSWSEGVVPDFGHDVFFGANAVPGTDGSNTICTVDTDATANRVVVSNFTSQVNFRAALTVSQQLRLATSSQFNVYTNTLTGLATNCELQVGTTSVAGTSNQFMTVAINNGTLNFQASSGNISNLTSLGGSLTLASDSLSAHTILGTLTLSNSLLFPVLSVCSASKLDLRGDGVSSFIGSVAFAITTVNTTGDVSYLFGKLSAGRDSTLSRGSLLLTFRNSDVYVTGVITNPSYSVGSSYWAMRGNSSTLTFTNCSLVMTSQSMRVHDLSGAVTNCAVRVVDSTLKVATFYSPPSSPQNAMSNNTVSILNSRIDVDNSGTRDTSLSQPFFGHVSSFTNVYYITNSVITYRDYSNYRGIGMPPGSRVDDQSLFVSTNGSLYLWSYGTQFPPTILNGAALQTALEVSVLVNRGTLQLGGNTLTVGQHTNVSGAIIASNSTLVAGDIRLTGGSFSNMTSTAKISGSSNLTNYFHLVLAGDVTGTNALTRIFGTLSTDTNGRSLDMTGGTLQLANPSTLVGNLYNATVTSNKLFLLHGVKTNATGQILQRPYRGGQQ